MIVEQGRRRTTVLPPGAALPNHLVAWRGRENHRRQRERRGGGSGGKKKRNAPPPFFFFLLPQFRGAKQEEVKNSFDTAAARGGIEHGGIGWLGERRIKQASQVNRPMTSDFPPPDRTSHRGAASVGEITYAFFAHTKKSLGITMRRKGQWNKGEGKRDPDRDTKEANWGERERDKSSVLLSHSWLHLASPTER
ncbi:hypothetical protein LX32DRAFT_407256 [Colletotrichum zoysiae]|uniref:Uncharacterized protein n=1 Tax=Colletotrichum zoysiae TaxID=1216348 RepID=A0AAD9LZC1_9PEZI|nr:hypothetical protein LX32DRAFT_407256 [Colletotrichum zoysiae]